jgi:hypothetical protein
MGHIMQDDTGQLEATFFDAARTFEDFKIRRGGAQKIKLQKKIDSELEKIANAERRLKVLRRVARGDYRDRAIYVDAIWQQRGPKIFGAAIAVFQDIALCWPANCSSPHELYSHAIYGACRKVLKQTGGCEGLTVNFAKTPDPATMRLLTEQGAWGEYYDYDGMRRPPPDIQTWMLLSWGFQDGDVRYRKTQLPEPYPDMLAHMADRARYLSGSVEELPDEAFDHIFNKPLRENPPAWFLAEAA